MNKSLAEQFLEQPPAVRKAKLTALTDAEAMALHYDWEFWARPSQKLPAGDWTFWLVMAGRGFGKTRVGAETVRQWVKTSSLVNLVGQTAADARDVMVEGPSGVMAVCPPGERPKYLGSKRQLAWPNGAKSLIFSAEDPDALRGPQHAKLWADEIAAFRYPEAWDQAKFGLRLGKKPQAVVTTTPRPTKVVMELVKDKATHLTVGTTYENRTNLAKQFYSSIITKYEGTRIGRQELNAELLDDNPHALFHRSNIDANRIRLTELPPLSRIVVPIDPAVTSNALSDETGIVAVGRDHRHPCHFYVLEDASGVYTPREWGERAVAIYRNQQADRIIGEVNNGGDLVESNIRNVDQNVPYKAVHATRGKEKRAEPISGLYQQNRVHHVGFFPKLEDQMCEFDPQEATRSSPDRLDSLVWGLSELSEGGFHEPVVEVIMHGRKRSDDWGWRRVS